jgi:transcriptional regulator with XRE-family HTH domain
MPARYLIRTDLVREHLDRRHMSHRRVARKLGLSAPYWSQLLNRRRALTPDMRHLMLSSGLFEGLAEDALWERLVDAPDPQPTVA